MGLCMCRCVVSVVVYSIVRGGVWRSAVGLLEVLLCHCHRRNHWYMEQNGIQWHQAILISERRSDI